ncbi:MAG: ATP-binding protein [Sulfurimonas sp.]|nr:ATP-binding protein [Sulfurimonas sp.]
MPSFQPKARTIDHLGKSQIADMPTAILELWKNGYDAYGDNMSCELFFPESVEGLNNYLMTVSDDGIGMSTNDVEDIWLTIGTDSKTRGIENLSKDQRLGKEERLKMGEKGIGRLSIAYLGSPMLMITKKKNEEPVLLLADWRVFTNYNLFLSDIDIPIGSGTNFQEIITTLKNDFLKKIDTGNWVEHQNLLEEIKKSISNIKLLDKFYSIIKDGFSLENSHGTMFIVFEFDKDQIGISEKTNFSSDKFDSDSEITAEWRANLRVSLSGMINPFKNIHSNIKTSFLVHNKEKTSYDIIARGSFFDETDVNKCEHSIEGKFDETGFFSGTVKVYGEVFNHTFRANRVPGNTSYGAFELKLGHIEGSFGTSKMNEDLYREIGKKMDAFGGLYIYKNDFRILPYGRQEYDFLKFEERRSKRAGTYFFSHRKMAGYIGLTNANNGFREKAGREGFIDTKAYKEFIKDLIEFFVDVAARFYKSPENLKETPEYEKTYRQKEVEKIKYIQEEINKKEKSKERKTKSLLKEKMNAYAPELKLLEDKIIEIETGIDNINGDIILSLEEYERLEDELALIKQKYNAFKLTGYNRLKFNDKEKYAFDEYKKKEYLIESKVATVSMIVAKVRSNFEVKELTHILEKKLHDKKQEFSKLTGIYRKDFHESLEKVKMHFSEKESYFKHELTEVLSSTKIDNIVSFTELNESINKVDQAYQSIMEKIDDSFKPFIEHIGTLDTDIDEDKLTGFYKNQYEEIKEKAESLYELSQLGMAIEIIDHQFNVLYSSVASSIKNLNYNIPDTNVAKENLDTLRHAIEHLESNHRLLTPLYRSNRRVKREVSGLNLVDYLKKFFGDKLEIQGRNILEVNDEFLEYKFYTFPSVLQPVFINIINNALYWLNSTTLNERKIIIGKYDNQIIIENNGKPIDDYDLKNVFKLFFSRRPSGRGIGLHLAKTNLHTIEMDIFASNNHQYKQLNGGCFVISLGDNK